MGEIPRQHILIVEDDERIVRLLKRLLGSAGYEVRAVECGESALDCLDDVAPHLVILDLGLPDMNGYELCRKLRETFHPWALPIVVLTGWDKPIDQLRGFAHGADAYLTKPCDPPELLSTISLLLDEPGPDPLAN